MTPRSLSTLSLLLLMTALVVGCGGKKNAPATVSGSVTYKNAPVTGGTIAFHSEGGVYSGVILPDGTYTIVDVPVGDMVVTVDTEALNPNIKKETYTGQTKGGPGGGKYGAAGGKSPAPSPSGAKAKYEASPAGEGSPQGEAGTYVQIPRTYADKNKSTLKVNVKDGKQQINLELKD